MYKLGLERQRNRDQLDSIHWIIDKAREFQKNNYFCFIDYPKNCVDHYKLWKTLIREMEISDRLTCLLRNLYTGQEATVMTLHGATGSKLRKEYDRAVYCYPVYLTYMQSTSYKMLNWVSYNLESRLLGEI